jgi:putative PIN family toxin of toxin-antitoxin system
MRCFIDSNIIISAGLFPDSVPAAAFTKAISPPNAAIVSDYSLDEIHRVIKTKFPNRVSDFELFLYRAFFTVQLISTPTDGAPEESKVRDIDDRPILRAAIKANSDVLITGDKDLLESGITHPRIVTATEFLNLDV